jgi:ParB family chromosome partitioning protein
MTQLQTIALDLLDEPADAHRINISEQQLGELADSIRDIGLLNPIIVRPVEGGRFEIIAGHRRFMAHRMLSRTEIVCFVREASDNEVEQGRFAENLQREQLSPMEEAVAIQRYMEREGKDAKATARSLNRSEWWVAHRVALISMPPELCDMVHTDKLAAGAALELAKVRDDKHRRYLLEYCVRSGASVAVVREWVSAWELQQMNAPDEDAPRPDMPVEGQEIIIQMPCYLCGAAHDHRALIIARVCRSCDGAVKKQG